MQLLCTITKDQTKIKKNDETVDKLDVNDSISFKYQPGLIKKQVTSVDVEQNRDPDVANAHRL